MRHIRVAHVKLVKADMRGKSKLPTVRRTADIGALEDDSAELWRAETLPLGKDVTGKTILFTSKV